MLDEGNEQERHMKPWKVIATLALAVVLLRGAIWAFPEAMHTRQHISWIVERLPTVEAFRAAGARPFRLRSSTA